MLDLVLPRECGGCRAPSTRALCDACARHLRVRPDEPHLIAPRVPAGVPVFSLGRYAGSRRSVIVAAKEHGRADLIGPLAAALRDGLRTLLDWGVLERPLTVVPAPTRRRAARRRGGDPVARIARAATADRDAAVVPALRMTAFVRDSVGLSSAARQRNVAGRVRLRAGTVEALSGDVVLVDDIVTTGATAAQSVRVLQTSGAEVVAVLALANA